MSVCICVYMCWKKAEIFGKYYCDCGKPASLKVTGWSGKLDNQVKLLPCYLESSMPFLGNLRHAT